MVYKMFAPKIMYVYVFHMDYMDSSSDFLLFVKKVYTTEFIPVYCVQLLTSLMPLRSLYFSAHYFQFMFVVWPA
jgi:hypothetical protein